MYSEIQVVIEQINRVIIGEKETLEYMVVALLSEGHILLEGLPGVGKTKLALALSKSIDARFKRVQFTPDVLPSDITGYYLYNRVENCMEYREGAALCNILLADEINRASPRVQSSLLEAMEERQITIEGKSKVLPKNFMVIATQNSIENEGTYPLPEAQLDRFFMKLYIHYPNKTDWRKIMVGYENQDLVADICPVMTLETLNRLKREVKAIIVSEVIYDYILDLISYINEDQLIEVGINPRGSLALLRGAKAWAYLKGRRYVLPDDVSQVMYPILSHRIRLKSVYGRPREQITQLIQDAQSKVRIPVDV